MRASTPGSQLRLAPFVPLLLAVVALAYFLQGPSENGNAHYALVRALYDGTPRVDRTRHEVGDLGTVDVSYLDGHYYANKAPGLAFATVPVYALVSAVAGEPTGDPTRILWLLGLWGLVLPGAIALLCVQLLGERVAPGFGGAAAVVVALGTLVLPFAGLFHAHVLSASLGFLAFAVLWLEREGAERLGLVALGGLLAGLAVTSEYPLALFAAVLAVYAIARDGRVRRLAAYAAGGALGVLPLALYNWWAFGSPTHLSYAETIRASNRTDVVDDLWTYIFDPPDAHFLAESLFARWGLVTATPVLAAAAVGIVVLYRRRRAEALVVAAVSVVFLLFLATLLAGAGGNTALPRYAVAILLFLGVPLAVALRAFPLPTAMAAVISVASMTILTATKPLAAWDGRVLERLVSSGGHGRTVFELAGITGWYGVLPFFALAALTLALAAARMRGQVEVSRRDLVTAAAAFVGWALVALEAPDLLAGGAGWRTLAALALAAAAVAAVVGVHRLAWRRPATS